MKVYTFLSVLMLVCACKTQNTVDSSKEIAIVSEPQNKEGYCPESGNCTVKLHKNSSLVLKKDTADSYYPVIEKGEGVVVEFEFLIKGPEGTADGDYSETIHFEINKAIETLNIKGEALGQVQLLFGKHCFCRGEAGYYKIKHGNLTLQKSKENINIDISFSIPEVSHKIFNIKEKIKL
ncbi:hypothetical protein ATO12_17970 [Aquimarina atlantica]|uniref:Lipoprotein n=1 Tax=Aquimarina atlantica TaxID=1317122 RepID=A0A023BV13_9FLAO|nr:hypothetical protein [Aquimarina atlantica]EZH73820.1 hypothetical protein ATO12_17970 [Aquimarina atlantica]